MSTAVQEIIPQDAFEQALDEKIKKWRDDILKVAGRLERLHLLNEQLDEVLDEEVYMLVTALRDDLEANPVIVNMLGLPTTNYRTVADYIVNHGKNLSKFLTYFKPKTT